MSRMFLAAAALVLSLALPALAVNPDEMLDDPALEARARDLSAGLRCLVCRNQSIDDSNAELARDLRVLLRERLTAGDTDEQAMAFLVERYGNFILLKPPLNPLTLALWAGPAVLLFVAVLGFAGLWRRSKTGETAPVDDLTEEDRAIIAAALGKDNDA